MTLLRKIGLLSWKNIKVLQRHWVKTSFEILIPLLLFTLIARLNTISTGSTEIVVDTPTYFKAHTEDDIINLFPRENVHVYYIPSNNFTNNLMEQVRIKLSFNKRRLISLSSELELENRFAINLENVTTHNNIIGVVFSNDDQMVIPKNLNYKIRSASAEWSTSLLFPTHHGDSLMDSSELYFRTGFLALQSVIDSSFIELVKPMDNPGFEVEMSVQEFPYPPYVTNVGFTPISGSILATVTLYAFLVQSLNILGKLVEDKQTGVTELMKLMGLSRLMLWLTWFLRAMFVNVLVVTIMVFLLKFTFNEVSGSVFPESDASLLWVVLLLLSVAVALFTFSISTLFSRPTFAVSFGTIILLVSYCVPTALIDIYKPTSLFVKLITCLHPNVAMYWGYSIYVTYEARHAGVVWSNVFKSPNGSANDLRMDHVFLMLFVDTLLYGVLTWYIDSVMPGEYGVPKPWYFCFTESYWCSSKVDPVELEGDSLCSDQSNCEPAPQGLKVGIGIRGLKKTYGSGKVAVNGVTIDIYEDQITALLGHNGAGKTTVMSIITGMLPSSSGSVWVNGLNIRTDMARVRESLGLCPQHNMLFADLTVMEHLMFFGMLKGCSYADARASAADLLLKLRLLDKSGSMASQLSGGMKRKLSLGVALIGDSRVVVLDEPTSGMDPEARRQIWDLLLGMRGRRTIIVTTHFMEEADVLGDRIAIMDHGKVQCYGTSHYLKKQYGAGYVLKLLVREPHDVPKISAIVENSVPGGKLKSHLGSELSYMLPAEQKSCFPTLFAAIESYKAELSSGITSMGVSLTTLEDVFLSVGNRAAEGEAAVKKRDSHSSGESTSTAGSERPLQGGGKPKTEGLALRLQQVEALFLKKIIFTWRKWFLFIILALVPLLLSAAAFQLSMLMLTLDIHESVKPARSLTLDAYDPSHVLLTSSHIPPVSWYERLVLAAGSTPQPVPAQSSVSSALLREGVIDMAKYRTLVVAADFNLTGVKLIVNALYSGFGYHSAPISLNLVNNAVLKTFTNSNEYSITVVNHPLESKDADLSMVQRTAVALIWQQMIPLGLLFLIGNFLVFTIVERSSGCKQLQLMTGVSPLAYWATCFLWDLLVYCLAAACVVLLLPLFDSHGYFGGAKEVGVFFLILFLYGVSGIPYAYWFGYFSKSPWSGFSIFVNVNELIGAVIPSIIFVTEGLLQDGTGWSHFLNVVKTVFYLCPNFCLSYSLMHFSQQALANNDYCALMSEAELKHLCLTPPLATCCSTESPVEQQSYLGFDSRNNPSGIGWPLMFLFFDSLLYFALVLLIDYGAVSFAYERLKRLRWARQTNEDQVDADVRTEINRVKHCDTNVLTVNDMMKVYGYNTLAVQGVSFGVMPGECFGLLGVNGAGKSTTFKMLTGDEVPTRGDAQIGSYVLSKNKTEYLSQIGYCPQFDAFNEVLTGREMLHLFASLRGIKKQDVQINVNKWLKQMGLIEYQDCLCGTYSGGNKRKLSTAMALIGDPPLVFLDEPTSGVDPVARRNLWSVLAKIQKTNRSIVLTSHSMEECEALSNRLAIMVRGQFVCIGEIQHLKQKFGQGFTVMVKLSNAGAHADRAADIKRTFEETFNDSILKDQHQGLLHYHLTNHRRTWSALFTSMETLKAQNDAVEDYTISETTLEQVFLSFAQTSSQ